MTTVTLCDGGCGRQSPDPATGLHEANGWTRIFVVPPHDRIKRSSPFNDDVVLPPSLGKIFCPGCFTHVQAAMARDNRPVADPPVGEAATRERRWTTYLSFGRRR